MKFTAHSDEILRRLSLSINPIAYRVEKFRWLRPGRMKGGTNLLLRKLFLLTKSIFLPAR